VGEALSGEESIDRLISTSHSQNKHMKCAYEDNTSTLGKNIICWPCLGRQGSCV